MCVGGGGGVCGVGGSDGGEGQECVGASFGGGLRTDCMGRLICSFVMNQYCAKC